MFKLGAQFIWFFGAKNAFRTETLEQRDDKVVQPMPSIRAGQKEQNLKYKQLYFYASIITFSYL